MRFTSTSLLNNAITSQTTRIYAQSTRQISETGQNKLMTVSDSSRSNRIVTSTRTSGSLLKDLNVVLKESNASHTSRTDGSSAAVTQTKMSCILHQKSCSIKLSSNSPIRNAYRRFSQYTQWTNKTAFFLSSTMCTHYAALALFRLLLRCATEVFLIQTCTSINDW